MKNKNKVSIADRIIIHIATFFGLAIILNIRLARIAFMEAKHRKPSGLIGWCKSRCHVYAFTPMWNMIHWQWVRLAKTEGKAKDAFFSVIDQYRSEDACPLMENAARRWSWYLKKSEDNYRWEMLRKLAWNWIPANTRASAMAYSQLSAFTALMIQKAKTPDELTIAQYYASKEPVLLGTIVERRAELT